jgi:ferredoxin
MKVVADFSRCESNAICAGLAPEVFDVGDDDFLHVTELPLDGEDDLSERVREAAYRCPKQALWIEEHS